MGKVEKVIVVDKDKWDELKSICKSKHIKLTQVFNDFIPEIINILKRGRRLKLEDAKPVEKS